MCAQGIHVIALNCEYLLCGNLNSCNSVDDAKKTCLAFMASGYNYLSDILFKKRDPAYVNSTVCVIRWLKQYLTFIRRYRSKSASNLYNIECYRRLYANYFLLIEEQAISTYTRTLHKFFSHSRT